MLYSTGGGLPVDRRSGLKWVSIAANDGHEGAKALRAGLRARLDPEAIAWAETEAAGFQPTANGVLADPPTVIFVQHRLNALGYDAGFVDGSMGPRTRAGIRRYQEARGRAVDGEVSEDLLMQILQEPSA